MKYPTSHFFVYHRIPMAAFKMKIAGREVTFQSEEDAARLLAALERVDEETPEKNGKPARATALSKGYNALQATVDFLEAIAGHKDGVDSFAISQALKCDPRGIGRRLLDVDEVLKPLGFKRERVYDHSRRLAEGGRMYLPGADAAAALEAVKRKAASG